jgi:hypothetical protein
MHAVALHLSNQPTNQTPIAAAVDRASMATTAHLNTDTSAAGVALCRRSATDEQLVGGSWLPGLLARHALASLPAACRTRCMEGAAHGCVCVPSAGAYGVLRACMQGDEYGYGWHPSVVHLTAPKTDVIAHLIGEAAAALARCMPVPRQNVPVIEVQ